MRQDNFVLADTAAIVLCGGKSSRMGRPKAWLPFGPNEVMLQRVVRLVGEAVSSIVVVAAVDQDLPPLPDSVTIARDEFNDRGPMQGLAAGMSAIPNCIEFVYATATDVPFLKPDWIRLLRSRIGGCDLATPFVGGFHQPLAALYRCEPARRAVAKLLRENRMGPYLLTEELRFESVEEPDLRNVDPELGTIRNLNTLESYEAALADLRAMS
jgi:molybdopterin-guanine dinucleotide biosynthesis protein A